MSHPITIARSAFNSAYAAMKAEFEANKLRTGIEHPEIYDDTVDRNLKVAAYDAAIEAVANATKSLEIEKLLSVANTAGLKYKPTQWEVREDGSRWVKWATVELAPVSHNAA